MAIKEIFDLAIDAWNRHDRDAFAACYADDCEVIAPDLNGKGHQGLFELWAQSMDGFPDCRLAVQRVVTDGTNLVEESLWHGTHTRPLAMPDGQEAPATGASVTVPYAGLHTVRDDKIISSRFYYDQMAFLGQLGLLPS